MPIECNLRCILVAALLLSPHLGAPAASLATPHGLAWARITNKSLLDTTETPSGTALDARGNVFVTGFSTNASGDADFYTAKYAVATGALLWEKRYDGPAHGEDKANALAVDASGNVFVTGSSASPTGGTDYYTVKYAGATGALLWEKRYNGLSDGGADAAWDLAVDGSGNVIVTGSATNAAGSLDYYTAKYAGTTGSLLWEKSHDGPANGKDYATALALDASGNVIVTGAVATDNHTTDYYTAKYAAATGALLWEKSYNGPGNSYDSAAAVAVDSGGNAVVTGYSTGTGSGTDYYTAKYAAATGALLWETRYNASANHADAATDLALDAVGNVIVTGYSATADATDFHTAKYAAATGALLWEKNYNGSPGSNSKDYARAVAVDGGGNVIVTGSSINGQLNYDFYTAKYLGATGALLWEKRYSGSAGISSDGALALALDAGGNVVVTGYSTDAGNHFDYYTAKYAAATGALRWENRYSGRIPGFDTVKASLVDAGGNLILAGYSEWSVGKADFYVAKCAGTSGALLWIKFFSSAYTYSTVSLALDHHGNALIAGSSIGANQRLDSHTAKYAAATGALLWEKFTNGPGNADDYANAIAVDASGNALITGGSTNAAGSVDFYTAKYAGASGALLWEKRYSGTENTYYRHAGNAVAVDGGDGVIVTGYYYSAISGTDYYTAKYAGANGALIWEKRYNGPANDYDYASTLALDSGGNALVTGYSYNANFDTDYLTVKYAAATGALLWEKRYSSPGQNNDQPAAIAVDSSDQVLVTGVSPNANQGEDYYTAKYAGATGALLWERRYNGPGNASDKAAALAVDASGNVVVTGTTDTTPFPNMTSDIYTAAYAAADGALLWENRHNGSGNGDDLGTCLALDQAANVFVAGSAFALDGTGDYLTLKLVPLIP